MIVEARIDVPPVHRTGTQRPAAGGRRRRRRWQVIVPGTVVVTAGRSQRRGGPVTATQAGTVVVGRANRLQFVEQLRVGTVPQVEQFGHRRPERLQLGQSVVGVRQLGLDAG